MKSVQLQVAIHKKTHDKVRSNNVSKNNHLTYLLLENIKTDNLIKLNRKGAIESIDQTPRTD